MSNPPALFNVDLSGLSSAVAILLLALALVGVLALAVIILLWLDERGALDGGIDPRIELQHGSVDRGAAIPDFFNEETVKGLAAHHQIEEPAKQVEKSRRWKISLNPIKWVGGSGEHGTRETHEPHHDMGEFIRRILRHLDDSGELNHVDRIFVNDMIFESIPRFGDPDSVRETLEAWLRENYPDGLADVDVGELARKMATIGTEVPESSIHERLSSALDRVQRDGSESILFLEGEWRVHEENGNVVLDRTDIRAMAGDGVAPEVRSVPLPSGASIKVRLEGDLTAHGRNRMVGVERPIRASVMGTVRQCDPRDCLLELIPMAVFQRVGSS